MSRSRRPAFVVLLLGGLLLLLGVPAAAQDGSPATAADEVEVRITDIGIDRYPEMTMVLELRNAEGFDPRDLTILESGEPVQTGTTTPISQNPVRVGIVLAIDTSEAAGEALAAAQAAANSFVDDRRPQDLIAIVGFGEEVDVFTGFTNNETALRFAISQLEAGGGTRLYDGIVRSVDLFTTVGSEATLERNVILLSDGTDTLSDATATDAQAALTAEEVTAFAVALGGEGFDPAGLDTLLGRGEYVVAPTPADLESVYGDIQRSLDNRIVLSFTAREQAPRDVTFEVTYVDASDSRVVTVPGFFLPASATTTLPPTFATPATGVSSSGGVSAGTLKLLSVVALGLAIVGMVGLLGLGRNTDVVAARLGAIAQTRRFNRPLGADGSEVDKQRFLARVPLLSRFATQAEEVAKQQGILQPIANVLEQANILWRPGEVVAFALGAAALSSLIAGVLTRSFVTGAASFVVLVLLIAVGLRFIATREKKRFEDQLPDTLGLIATSLRSGQSFLQALEAVASEASEPTAREYQRAIAEVRLGRPIGTAIGAIADRMDSEDFGWVVMATDIQREVGGNLAEVLDIVADTMLQRNRLRREVRALSAEGRISAIVLGSLPVFIFLFLFTSNREYLEPLVDRTAGWIMIGVAISSMIAAFAWLRKIVNIQI